MTIGLFLDIEVLSQVEKDVTGVMGAEEWERSRGSARRGGGREEERRKEE